MTACSPLEIANTRPPPTQNTLTATFEVNPTAEPTSPFLRPIPNFPGIVTGLTVENSRYILRSDELCIYLRLAPFWEPGDYFLSFDSFPPVSISIDDIPVTQLKRYGSGALEIRSDENGNEIGALGYSMDFCFSPRKIGGLENGSHRISIVVVSTSGSRYSYSWNFNI